MVRLEGTYTAMVTPFKNGQLNESKLREMVNYQIDNGISGLVPVGTTGESPTLSHEEHRRVVDIVIDEANGRVPIIAGAGSNNTTEAISLTQHAQKSGATAALLITPYYNRPSQAGLIEHFKAIAGSCDLPLIIYNCPGRTAVNTTADTIVELSELPTIVGIKEASGNMDQICEIITRTDDDFIVLSGDDSMTVPMVAVGAKGIISVTSNAAPALMSAMTAAALKGDFATAGRMHNELFPLMRAMMKAETNPSPVKAAMNIMGLDVGPVRLPLVEPSENGKDMLARELKKIGLI